MFASKQPIYHHHSPFGEDEEEGENQTRFAATKRTQVYIAQFREGVKNSRKSLNPFCFVVGPCAYEEVRLFILPSPLLSHILLSMALAEIPTAENTVCMQCQSE